MGIIGVHTLVYTTEPEAVRAVFADVFGFGSVDAGVHRTDGNEPRHPLAIST